MAKLTFNDHLDDMMERLMNEDITPEELEKEVRRSKALCQIAEKKIEHNKVIVNAAVLISKGEIKTDVVKDVLKLPE